MVRQIYCVARSTLDASPFASQVLNQIVYVQSVIFGVQNSVTVRMNDRLMVDAVMRYTTMAPLSACMRRVAPC